MFLTLLQSRGGPAPVTPSGGGDSCGNGVKAAICRRDDETGRLEHEEVPASALKPHEKHGDMVSGVTGPESCAALRPAPEQTPERVG